MAAPRVHPAGDRGLRLESGDVFIWPEAVRPALEEAGFEVVAVPSRDFGRVHAVWFDPATGSFTGVAEPRWDGGAAGPRDAVLLPPPVSPSRRENAEHNSQLRLQLNY